MIPKALERAEVVAGATVTLILAIAGGITLFLEEIEPALPDGWQDNVVSGGGRVVTLLFAIVAVIRRVTEVPKPMRGLLVSPTVAEASWPTDDGSRYAYQSPPVAGTSTTAATTVVRSNTSRG